MDTFVMIGGFLCLAANLFAIASIITPEWIVHEYVDSTRLGLTVTCLKSPDQDEVCIQPNLPEEWVAMLAFIFLGIMCLTLSCAFILASPWRPRGIIMARWITFTALILFCIAVIIFPFGFYAEEVGGKPYQLPVGTTCGVSFFLFIFSIVFTIMAELFIFKVCPLLFR